MKLKRFGKVVVAFLLTMTIFLSVAMMLFIPAVRPVYAVTGSHIKWQDKNMLVVEYEWDVAAHLDNDVATMTFDISDYNRKRSFKLVGIEFDTTDAGGESDTCVYLNDEVTDNWKYNINTITIDSDGWFGFGEKESENSNYYAGVRYCGDIDITIVNTADLDDLTATLYLEKINP